MLDACLIHIALYKPEIHPNAGNIARLCAANGFALHLVGNLGFRIDDRSVRRAGLDYWPHVDLRREENLEDLYSKLSGSRFFYFSTHADRLYTDIEYRLGDCLVFGPESMGLPDELLRSHWENALKIPMRSSKVRSLNLANAVAIAAYEALRQIQPSWSAGVSPAGNSGDAEKIAGGTPARQEGKLSHNKTIPNKN
jgi:tRNA (cytidine/uridine-2'-O-)-methyltransferase